MKPRELIRACSDRFRSAGIPDPENDAALILSHLTGKAPLSLRLDEDTELTSSVISAFDELACKRLERIPLQYLLGTAPFYGRMFHVAPRVLIPRPETELLCEWALELLRNRPSPRILDLCCGSGCIGLTMKAERPDASVMLSDISPEALEVAAGNAKSLGLDVSFSCGDLLEGFKGSSFDMIVSNPPYIPSAECNDLQQEVLREPRLALDGGTDGLALYRRIISDASSVLVPDGMLLMELGEGEADAVSSLLAALPFQTIRLRKDLSGIRRMILAEGI